MAMTGEAWSLEAVVKGNDGAEMVIVPEGEFIMGLSPEEKGYEKNPLRRIYLSVFYIDKYEVTNTLYHRCVKEGSCAEPDLIVSHPKTIFEDGKRWYRDAGMGSYPVVGVVAGQAEAYCRWAGKRLPTAAEWEKAARGIDGRRYPWGNAWHANLANWGDRGKRDGFKKIAPVGSFPKGASPYGVMDMAGNVREFTSEDILKGGSWWDNPWDLQSADPGIEGIVERDDNMGFRCAKYP